MATQTIKLTDSNNNTTLPEAAESGEGYCKMADGTLICYGQYHYSSTSSTSEGALYVAQFMPNIVYSQTFISAPAISASISSSGGGIGIILEIHRDVSGISQFKVGRHTNDKIYANIFH